MGMFDSLYAKQNNPFGLPKGEWQFKDLDNGLCQYTVDRHGRITAREAGIDTGYPFTGKSHQDALNGDLTADIDVYVDKLNSDYHLRIRRNRVISVIGPWNTTVWQRWTPTYLNVHPLRRLCEMYIEKQSITLGGGNIWRRRLKQGSLHYQHVKAKVERLAAKSPRKAHNYLDRIGVLRLYP